jgi:hypothetical protein
MGLRVWSRKYGFFDWISQNESINNENMCFIIFIGESKKKWTTMELITNKIGLGKLRAIWFVKNSCLPATLWNCDIDIFCNSKSRSFCRRHWSRFFWFFWRQMVRRKYYGKKLFKKFKMAAGMKNSFKPPSWNFWKTFFSQNLRLTNTKWMQKGDWKNIGCSQSVNTAVRGFNEFAGLFDFNITRDTFLKRIKSVS